MAIRLPSLVQTSSTVWSGDRALDLPDLHRYYDAQLAKSSLRDGMVKSGMKEDALEKAIKEHDAEIENLRLKTDEDLRKLNVSRETGDYGPILKSGETPTWFHFRVIPGSLMREFQNALMSEEVSNFKIPSLAFRLSITKIENLDGLKIETEDDQSYGKIAKASLVDSLDMISPGIVNELGNYALNRSFPKSV